MAICCDELRPDDALPANPATIVLFWRYKFTDLGAHVTNAKEELVHWADGSVMKGQTDKRYAWCSPVNIRHSRDAIRMLHMLFVDHHNKQYNPACINCVNSNKPVDWSDGDALEFWKGGQWNFCAKHTPGKSLMPSGDPTTERTCLSFFKDKDTFLTIHRKYMPYYVVLHALLNNVITNVPFY